MFNSRLSVNRCLLSAMLVIILSSAFPLPVFAGLPDKVLEWTEIEKPGARNFTILSPSEVSKIVVSKGNILYVIDSASNRVYRSDNAGLSWNDLTPDLINAGAAGTVVDIAVSPDTAQVVAVVTDGGNKVFASMDNGVNWVDAQVPAMVAGPPSESIQCIAISRGYYVTFPAWDIAIGTARWGTNASDGQIWVRQIGGVSSGWTSQDVTVDVLPGHIGADVSSLTFAQGNNYLAAVVSTGADTTNPNKTLFCIGQRMLSGTGASLSCLWNSNIPGGDFAGYPVAIGSSLGDNGAGTRVITTISLPSDFSPSGRDISSRSSGAESCLPSSASNPGRRAFISFYRIAGVSDPANDVYFIDDINCYDMNVGGGGATDVRSVAYYGTVSAGTLLAGYAHVLLPSGIEVDVRRCLNPLDSTPSWQSASRPPTGPGSAFVAWSVDGSGAFCGTSWFPGDGAPVALDESAFSRSTDLGDTWEQTSLIDTDLRITDIAPSPDSLSLFMTSYSTNGTKGLWRTTGKPLGAFWGRILTNMDANNMIIRLSPGYADDYTLYIAGIGGDRLYVSHDRGNHWKKQVLPAVMVDFTVADRDTVYIALQNGKVRKTLNTGGFWLGPVATGLKAVNMITVTPNGHVLAASEDGRVAWSSNGGESFNEIPEAIDASGGFTQVTADPGYANNNVIYAATDNAGNGIQRWRIGASTEWEQIDRDLPNLGTQRISGLATGSEGTLYALRQEPLNLPDPAIEIDGDGGMDRTLNPLEPYTRNIEFNVLNHTLPANTTFNSLFPHPLPHLKISGDENENDLWAIDTLYDLIYVFRDNLCKTGPEIMGADIIGCDPVTGRNQEYNTTWEQLSLSDRHQLRFAKDSRFALLVSDIGNGAPGNPFFTPVSVTSPSFIYWTSGGTIAAGAIMQPLECGHSYYWKVRTRHAATGEYIRSPWSQYKKFTVKAGYRVTATYYGPQLLYPASGCGCACDAPVNFSWSPFKETVAYRFELSEKPDMTDPLVSRIVRETTAYDYEDYLDCNSAYFWRVMAVEPAPSEWSAIFTFKTKPDIHSETEKVVSADFTPLWIWMVIGTGVLLAAGMMVYIVTSRRAEE